MTIATNQAIPDYVKPYLWSYDVSHLDLEQNQERIILNVLNLGSQRAVQWLFSTYDRAVIMAAVAAPRSGEWSKKSLRFWSLIFDLPYHYPTARLV